VIRVPAEIFLWYATVTSDAPVISKKTGHLSDQECGSPNLYAEDTTIQPLEAEDNAKSQDLATQPEAATNCRSIAAF
jgi:hypothetical protein